MPPRRRDVIKGVCCVWLVIYLLSPLVLTCLGADAAGSAVSESIAGNVSPTAQRLKRWSRYNRARRFWSNEEEDDERVMAQDNGESDREEDEGEEEEEGEVDLDDRRGPGSTWFQGWNGNGRRRRPGSDVGGGWSGGRRQDNGDIDFPEDGPWFNPRQDPFSPQRRPPTQPPLWTQPGLQDGWNRPPDRDRQGSVANPRPSTRTTTTTTRRPPTGDRGQSGQVEERRCGVTIEVPRIINGKEAQRGEFPWQAALVYERGGQRRTQCGGALVHPRFVLTAAHCVDPATIKGYRLVEVRLGLTQQRRVDGEARSYAPDRQLAHPQYRRGVTQRVRNLNDIALLRLPEPAPYTEYIRPVCLPSPVRNGNDGDIASTLLVAGWGITEKQVFSESLMFARVPAVDARTCSERLGVDIPASQVCAGGDRTDSCNGDSGGPLIQANPDANGDMVFQVVGLVSFGPTNCGTLGTPGAYTRVAAFRSWIDEMIRENS